MIQRITTTLLMAVLLAGCPPKGTAPVKDTALEEKELLIIYSGNTFGELKPCGCDKEEEQGGIERRMSYLKSTRTATTLLVDLGDNFKEATRQGKLKAEYLIASMLRMEYDAVTIGEKDLVYGNGFLKNLGPVPWVSSNIAIEGISFPPYRVKQFKNGLKVAVLAVSGPDLFYGAHDSNLKVNGALEAVKRVLPGLIATERPHLVVLLSHMAREQGLKLLEVEGVDVVINGHIETDSDKIDMAPVQKGQKVFVQPGPLGQKMGELRIAWSAGGARVFDQKMVRLDSKIAFDPEMVSLYEAYNTKVEDLFLAALAEKRRKKSAPVYATEKTCLTCHAASHKVWAASRHGHAYETLKRVNKSYDPECLICHTTGFNEPGGFISEIDTPDLKNVQCEMCHGPRLQHAQAPRGGFAKLAVQSCQRCHMPKHSPKFNYGRYWPRVQH